MVLTSVAGILNAHNGIRWHEEVFKWIDHWTAVDGDGAQSVVQK